MRHTLLGIIWRKKAADSAASLLRSPRQDVETEGCLSEIDTTQRTSRNPWHLFSIISDEQLILSTPSGYQFNPDLHITTDFQRFDELCIAAAKATSAINKVRLLEKAASLYQGKLLSAANGEHWLVHYANRYHLAFMSTVNELLKQLMDFHAYDLLHRDAALALTIAPENTKAYYWLIRSYQKQHMDEMAAGELAAAKQKLPEDEYQKLLNSLE